MKVLNYSICKLSSNTFPYYELDVNCLIFLVIIVKIIIFVVNIQVFRVIAVESSNFHSVEIKLNFSVQGAICNE